MLKEVFEALQLFDFAEFLEKATKPRTLRPALPLKEIEKLSNVSNCPTKVYSKAEVLIIELCEGPQLPQIMIEMMQNELDHFLKP